VEATGLKMNTGKAYTMFTWCQKSEQIALNRNVNALQDLWWCWLILVYLWSLKVQHTRACC